MIIFFQEKPTLARVIQVETNNVSKSKKVVQVIDNHALVDPCKN